MSARTAASWQTSLADLSLILFMLSAAAISRQQSHLRQETQAQTRSREAPLPSPEGTPLAIYIAAPGAPPLTRWLAEQAGDPRQRVTVIAPYGSASVERARSLPEALAEAGRLAAEAEAAGHKARIVVEPGSPPARVVLAFDDPGEAMARSLLGSSRTGPHGPREGLRSR